MVPVDELISINSPVYGLKYCKDDAPEMGPVQSVPSHMRKSKLLGTVMRGEGYRLIWSGNEKVLAQTPSVMLSSKDTVTGSKSEDHPWLVARVRS